jgi:type I restriction enzyme, S subunit
MASRFDLAELADAGVSVLDCEHKTPPDAGYGHPYVAIPNLVDGRLDLTSVRRITDEDLREWTRRTRPQAGDVIVTRRGRVGDSAVVPEGLNCAIGQNLVILRSVTSRVDPGFLRYAARGRLWADEVDRLRNVGAVFDSLNVRDIARIRIPIPPVDEQQRIASVLGVLDNKIDSNRRLASLLEETAATMFRARFIDFIGASAFKDSEIGMIPADWSVGSLSDMARVLSGGTPPTSSAQYWDGDIPWIAVKDTVPGPYVVETDRAVTELAVSETRLRRYPTDTLVITARGTVGNVALMARPMTVNQSCYALLGRDGVGQLYLFFLLRHAVATLRARSHGSVFPTITRRTFDSVVVACPPRREMSSFEQVVAPMFAAIRALTSEARYLVATRDVLLPKLVSGEVRVPDPTDSESVIGLGLDQLARATT